MDGYHGDCLTTTLATGIFGVKTGEVIRRLSRNLTKIGGLTNIVIVGGYHGDCIATTLATGIFVVKVTA